MIFRIGSITHASRDGLAEERPSPMHSRNCIADSPSRLPRIINNYSVIILLTSGPSLTDVHLILVNYVAVLGSTIA